MNMDASNSISVEQFCRYYKIESTFIQSLDEYGLVVLTRTDEGHFINYDELGNIERYIHLHYDLNINMEGLDAISHLLTRVDDLQQELKRLRSSGQL